MINYLYIFPSASVITHAKRLGEITGKIAVNALFIRSDGLGAYFHAPKLIIFFHIRKGEKDENIKIWKYGNMER